MREQVEVYLGCSGKGREALTTCAEILDAWCISKPTEGDIERLKAELLARGKAKQTVANWLSTFRKFLNWRQTQEGEAEQMSLGFDEQERAGQQNEPETPAVSENTSTGEGKDTGILEHEPVEQEHTPITGTEGQDEPVDVEVQDEPDTRTLSVEAVQEGQPRRGRKPKAENADRVQITVYVRGSVYEGLKTLAQVKSLNISDIAAKAIDRVVEQNSQTIAIAQQALRNLAALNVEI